MVHLTSGDIYPMVSACRAAIRILFKHAQHRNKNQRNNNQSTDQQDGAGSNSSTSQAIVSSSAVSKLCSGPPESSCTATAEGGVKHLQGTYAAMAAAFAREGLDLAAIAEAAAWFETGTQQHAQRCAILTVLCLLISRCVASHKHLFTYMKVPFLSRPSKPAEETMSVLHNHPGPTPALSCQHQSRLMMGLVQCSPGS